MIRQILFTLILLTASKASSSETPLEYVKSRDLRPVIISELDRKLATLLGSWIEMTPQEKVSYALAFIAQTPGLLEASGLDPNSLHDLKVGHRLLTEDERARLHLVVTEHLDSHLDSYLKRLEALREPKSFGHSLVGLGVQGVLTVATGILTSAALWSGEVPEQSSLAALAKVVMTLSAVYLSYLPIRIVDRLAKEGLAQQEYQALIANAAQTHGIPQDLVKSWYILRFLEVPQQEIACAGLLG